MRLRVMAALGVALSVSMAGTLAQAPPPPAGAPAGQGQPPAPAGQGRGRGGFGAGIPVTPFEDRTGFEAMFNGTSLTPGDDQVRAAQEAAQKAAAADPAAAGRGRGRGGGAPVSRFQDWDGDPKFWRVENGTIVGESTPDKPVGPNTFLIWKGATPGDFELKVELKMNATNSGIQYRSRMLPASDGRTPGHAWRLGGYQMDLDFANAYSGQLYEEAGRGFLAYRGTAGYVAPDGTKGTLGQLRTADEVKAAFKPGDWNQFHIIARGNTLIHIMNGLVTAVLIDDDLKGRSMAGLVGFQLHQGEPMKLEIRNPSIKLK
jgi:3-keto-disaccharide hydrolase